MPIDLFTALLFAVTVLAFYAFLITWWPPRSQRRLRDLFQTPAPQGLSTPEPIALSPWKRWSTRLTQMLLRISPWLIRKPQTTGVEPSDDAPPPLRC